jgi:hypothetical protein
MFFGLHALIAIILHEKETNADIHGIYCCSEVWVQPHYSETLILLSWILHFSRIQALLHSSGQIPITIMLNFNEVYISTTLCFS